MDLSILEQACHELFLDVVALENSSCGSLEIDNASTSITGRSIGRQFLVLGRDFHKFDESFIERFDAEPVIEQREECRDHGTNDEESPPSFLIPHDQQAAAKIDPMKTSSDDHDGKCDKRQ